MRVATGAFMQESNSFAARPAARNDFEKDGLWYGEEIFERMRGTNTEIGGFIETAEAAGVTLVPMLRAWALSAGPLPDMLFQEILDDLLARLKAALPVDGVLLALHGAMEAASTPSADGAILAAVRKLVGPDVPIAASLDLHACVSEEMVANADILVGYSTYPHVDFRDTGKRAAELLFATLRGELQPCMAMTKVPLVVPAENQQTASGPMHRIIGAARALEQEGTAVSTSLFPVQPWLNVPELGFAAVVITDGDQAEATEAAHKLGKLAWRLRDDFFVPKLRAMEAIRYAVDAPAGPLVLADLGDATGGGASGDSAEVLAEVLPYAEQTTALLTLVDAQGVGAAIKAGVGAEVALQVGGSIDSRYRSVAIHGRVIAITDGRYYLKGPAMTGMKIECGRTVVIQQGGVRIVLTERPPWTVDPSFYRSVGQEPVEMKIVVVKSPNQFRAMYGEFAAEILLVNSPGPCTADLPTLPFTKVNRPIYPLDSFEWSK